MLKCPHCGTPNPERLSDCYRCEKPLRDNCVASSTVKSPTDTASVPPPLPVDPSEDGIQDINLFADGKQMGPFSKTEVAGMWSSGQLPGDTLYWQPGMSNWVPVVTLVNPSPIPAPPPSDPMQVTYNPAGDTFSGTMPLMVKLAMRAIQDLRHKLDNVNDSIGLVTFQTGMTWGSWSGVSCSLNIEEIGINTFRVSGAGKQNVRGGQLLALNLFNEAKGKADKVINRMKELANQ